ncbi:hypothetical protein D3C80_1789590 [compost metagenome]
MQQWRAQYCLICLYLPEKFSIFRIDSIYKVIRRTGYNNTFPNRWRRVHFPSRPVRPQFFTGFKIQRKDIARGIGGNNLVFIDCQPCTNIARIFKSPIYMNSTCILFIDRITRPWISCRFLSIVVVNQRHF